MRKWVLALFAGLMVLYPILMYLGLQKFNVQTVSLLLLALAVGRFALLRKAGRVTGGALMAGIAALVAILALVSNQPDFFLYYPVAMNLALLAVFGSSLMHPPSVIERIARLQEPDLPPSGIAYTRKVTVVWCWFFLINGGLALYTASFCSMQAWTLYNGLLAYVAMGVLMGAEFLVRQRVRRRGEA